MQNGLSSFHAKTLCWHSKSTDPTGLIWMGTRYYDPKAGRFISPDPLGHPICMDLYTYAGGDPVNYFDPDGRFSSPVYSTIGPTSIAGLHPSSICTIREYCPSYPFKVGSVKLANGGIGFVNGIDNTAEEAFAKALQLSNYAGGVKIHGVYNASNDLGRDLIEAIRGHLGSMSPQVQDKIQKIKDNWHSFFATRGPSAKFLQSCHSFGATLTKQALLTSSEEIRQCIIVLAIAPAEIVPEEFCFQSYNYASRRDFVPFLDIEGVIKYGNQLTILKPHPDAGLLDHDFLSPTYAERIEHHIKKFIKDFGGERQ